MATLRRWILTALPKVWLSRMCGWLAALPLPRGARRPLFTWFARRYGADLAQVDGELDSFRSLQQFFRRPLRGDARQIASASLVCPCDGRVVTAGPFRDGRIPQVKGHDYPLADLLGDDGLARELDGGQQITIYLAPGDYHRVHAPFAGEVLSVTPLRGTLFPVNPPAVRCIDDLFARNSRHVFRLRSREGVPAALVMVGAFNVGATLVTIDRGPFAAGQELGQFGFGSTVVLVLAPGFAAMPELPPERRLQMGEALSG